MQQSFLKSGKLATPKGSNFAGTVVKLDVNKGAPLSIRALVGNRENQQERLELLKQYYPDARGFFENDKLKKIADEFGYGEDNFANMQEWAAANLTDAEKKAYSMGINSSNIEQVKLTVAGLHARYVASVGNEPTLLSGRPASGSADRFESVAQLEVAMNDPMYAKDEAYRAKVQDKLSRSNIF